MDGTGAPARPADVVIDGGVIRAVTAPGQASDGEVAVNQRASSARLRAVERIQ